MQFTEKTALVCGATQGIGLACAEALANGGAAVVLIARDAERLASVVASLPRPVAGQEHEAIVADFSDPAATRATVDAWIARRGAIHILVNNSGGPPGGPITEATPEQFLAAFRGHLLTSHLLVQAVLPGMRAARFGRVVNIVSTSVKQPLKGLGVSNTTRGAVASWAKTLASEVARDGITVNNVLPGATRTARLAGLIEVRARNTGRPAEEIEREMLEEIPAGRFAAPEEIAAAVTFLASPAAGYITGVSLAVDGGRTTAL